MMNSAMNEPKKERKRTNTHRQHAPGPPPFLPQCSASSSSSGCSVDRSDQYPQIRLHSPQMCSRHAPHFQKNGCLDLLQRPHSCTCVLLLVQSADLTNWSCPHDAAGIFGMYMYVVGRGGSICGGVLSMRVEVAGVDLRYIYIGPCLAAGACRTGPRIVALKPTSGNGSKLNQMLILSSVRSPL